MMYFEVFKTTQLLCITILRKSKSEYFGSLNEKKMSDNNTFWKTIKPFLSDKITSTLKITLIEKEEIIMGDDYIASLEYFLF